MPAADRYDPDALVLVQVFPVPGGSYTDTFGAPRPGGRTHQGDDIFAPLGSPVLASTTGRVHNYVDGLGGRAVQVFNSHGHTYGAHLARWAVKEGTVVRAGTVIGYVDHTGDAVHTSDHLHFEVHPRNGSAIDPTPYLDRVRAVSGGSVSPPGTTVGPLPVIPTPAKMVHGESAADVIHHAAADARRSGVKVASSTKRIVRVTTNWR